MLVLHLGQVDIASLPGLSSMFTTVIINFVPANMKAKSDNKKGNTSILHHSPFSPLSELPVDFRIWKCYSKFIEHLFVFLWFVTFRVVFIKKNKLH